MSWMARMERMERRGGFTLLEVMVTLLIISILAALAYPSYLAYIVKGKRVQGQASLFQLMQQEERYFSQNNTYIVFSASSSAEDERIFQWWSGDTAARSAYEIQAEACPGDTIAQCVQLSALPGTRNVDTSFRDADCATLTLSSNGRRAASGPSTRCWP